MTEENRQKMIAAIKMMQEVCSECESCLNCPFEYCDYGNEPISWRIEEE